VNDADLIQRFIAGQSQAFNTLVWPWQGRLYNLVLRYIGDPEEARDLCQQSFIRAHRQLHRLRDPERFATWLYQIAANTCRDHLRRRKPHVSLDAYQEENGQPHPALTDDARHSPADELYRGELRAVLNRALQLLPAEQCVVVVLKEYQGLKFAPAASPSSRTQPNACSSK
jgi:RNA polymerase sigma-70 factor (ECF subfamily)